MIVSIINEKKELLKKIDYHINEIIAFENFLGYGEGNIEQEKLKMSLVSSIDLYSDTYVSFLQKEMFIQDFQNLKKYTENLDLKKFCINIIDELKNLNHGNFMYFMSD